MAALIATLAAVAFTLARWQTWANGHISRFILVGRHFAIPSQLPHGMPVAKTYGYDGQFFYRLALNPLNFHHTAYGITMDRPYRYMRIGYPALTWLVSAGQHALVPVMLVVINIAAIGALGYLGAMFAAQGGRHAAWGLLLPGYFGLLTSLSRDTAEPLAAVCLLAGLLAVRSRRPVLAAVLLAYGALTRETVMVAVAAIAIVRVIGMLRGRVRPGRDDLAWVVPAAAFAVWEVVVKLAIGTVPLLADGGRNAGAPFIAPSRPSGTTSVTSTCTSSSSTTCGSSNWPSWWPSRWPHWCACGPPARRCTSGWPWSSTWSRSASSPRAPGTAWTPTCGRSSRSTCWR